MTSRFNVWSFIILLTLSAGCTRFRRQPAGDSFLTRDGTIIREFIDHVVARESGVRNMQARTRFSLDSPDLKRRVTLRGFVAFATPDKLRVQGHAVFGIDAFDLISVGPSFYLHIPSEDKTFYQHDGVPLEGVPFSVSPVDVAREMFGPFTATPLRSRDLRLLGVSDELAVLECVSGTTRHIVTVDTQWRVLKRVRYDGDRITCTAVMDNYDDVDGTLFPHRIELEYPARKTSVVMDLSRVQINGKLNPALFELPAGL